MKFKYFLKAWKSVNPFGAEKQNAALVVTSTCISFNHQPLQVDRELKRDLAAKAKISLHRALWHFSVSKKGLHSDRLNQINCAECIYSGQPIVITLATPLHCNLRHVLLFFTEVLFQKEKLKFGHSCKISRLPAAQPSDKSAYMGTHSSCIYISHRVFQASPQGCAELKACVAACSKGPTLVPNGPFLTAQMCPSLT